MTKDQVSDLRSFSDRVVQCALEAQRSSDALKFAQSQLESFLWKLEHEEEKK